MKRVFGGALAFGIAALGLAGVGAGPAGADTSATVTFTAPATDGMTMTSPAALSGAVDQPQGVVDQIDVTVRWTDTVNRPPAPHPTQQTSITPPTRAANASWSFTPQPAANGRYTVTVVATTHTSTSPQSQTTAGRSFVLDVNPAVPANVAVTADAAQRTARVTWAPNPEPDLVGYEVLRAGPGPADSAKIIAGVEAPATDYTDTSVATQPAGTYRYSVVAVRQSGDGTKADFSAPSGEVTTTFSTPPKSQAPPPPATQAPAKPAPTASTAGGPSTPARPGASGPGVVLAAPGRTGLPDYQNLLNQAQASTVTTEPPDPGFGSKLPYQAKTTHKVLQIPGATLESGSLGGADSSEGVRRTAEFVAGALVLAVLALFGWVLKRAAEQPTPLEALAPAADEAAAAAVPSAVGPSLMLTIVRPHHPEPTPVER